MILNDTPLFDHEALITYNKESRERMKNLSEIPIRADAVYHVSPHSQHSGFLLW